MAELKSSNVLYAIQRISVSYSRGNRDMREEHRVTLREGDFVASRETETDVSQSAQSRSQSHNGSLNFMSHGRSRHVKTKLVDGRDNKYISYQQSLASTTTTATKSASWFHPPSNQLVARGLLIPRTT